MDTGIHIQGPTFPKEFLKAVEVLAKIAERAQRQGDRETARAVVESLKSYGGSYYTTIQDVSIKAK